MEADEDMKTIEASMPTEAGLLEEASSNGDENSKTDSDDRSPNVGQIISSPILLPTVLEHVFRNLPYLDLQNCRQVCKLWDKEALRTLEFRLKIDLSDPQNVKQILGKVREQNLQVAELSVFDLDLNEKTFQELFFHACPTLAVFRIFDSQASTIQWQKLMRRAKYLVRMEIGTLKDGDSLIKTFPISPYGHPHEHIQFLHLQYLEFLASTTPQPVLLSDIVRSCPNLKKLVTGNFMKEDPKNFEGLQLEQLDTLDIAIVSGLLMDCLLKLNLTVKILVLSNFVPDLSPTLIRKFIESQNDTIKNLVLAQGRTEEDPFVEHTPCCPFPFSLGNLENLQVEKPFVRNMSHVINAEHFPSMRHVDLRFDPGSNWERCLPKNMRSHDGVAQLSIQWIEERPLMQMAKAFPKLRELDIMYCDDKLLRIIFMYLPALEVLSVEDSEYRVMTDEGFTGFSAGSNDQAVRAWPYIGSLKNLHLLSLDFKYHPATEKSILKGIVEVTSLKVLRIFGMNISPEVAEIVLEKLVNLQTHCIEVESSHDSTFDSTMHFSETESECSMMGEFIEDESD